MGTKFENFKTDMESAGYDVRDYEGRNFYKGPSVVVDRSEYQDVIRATTIRLIKDDMGKSDIVVYPG